MSCEVNSHKEKIGRLEENIHHRCRQIAIFQNKIDKTGRELIEERQKSNDFVISLASAEKKAAQEVEHIKKKFRTAVFLILILKVPIAMIMFRVLFCNSVLD